MAWKDWKDGGMPLGLAEMDTVVYSDDACSKAGTALTTTAPAPTPLEREDTRLLRDKALAYVNTARTALGFAALEELPRGHQGKANNCVIARALPDCLSVPDDYVDFYDDVSAKLVAKVWATEAQGRQVVCPDALRKFICHFDCGSYPDLVLV